MNDLRNDLKLTCDKEKNLRHISCSLYTPASVIIKPSGHLVLIIPSAEWNVYMGSELGKYFRKHGLQIICLIAMYLS